MDNKKPVKILFVCMGNICRSPTAHAVFRKLVRDEGLEQHIEIDSAGTHAYHVGNPPDSRSMSVARGRGIEMNDLRARKVDFGDFIEYDYVLAMDQANYSNLRDLALPEHFDKIRLFLEFADNFTQSEVPDPYYGGQQGFDLVFDMVTDASEGLLRHIREHHID